MLILFDVDATLITTSRTGIAAMGDAGRDLFGPSFDETRVEYAGRLDPLIIADLHRAHGLEPDEAAMRRFRAAYLGRLEQRLSVPGLARPCPGVPELLIGLSGMDSVVLGLLTGNYPETGSVKLRAAGIDPGRFPIRVWGDESPSTPPTRADLPQVALDRYRALAGREPVDVVIVGDTPHDVACAKAHRCRALGVATGPFGVSALRAAGADHAVEFLTPTSEVIRWLTTPTNPRE